MSTQEIVMGQALPPDFDDDEMNLYDDVEQVSFQECLAVHNWSSTHLTGFR